MPDKVLTRAVGDTMIGLKRIADWGHEHGHIDPDELRYTIETRQRKAREMVASGMTHTQTARILKVSKQTITRDLNGRKSQAVTKGNKNVTKGNSDLVKRKKAPGVRPPAKDLPINRQVNYLTRPLDDYVPKWCEEAQRFWSAHDGMKEEYQERILQIINVSVERLQRLTDTLIERRGRWRQSNGNKTQTAHR